MPNPESRATPFIGEGEMATRMRALDWTSTPLGDPRSWPEGSRATVRILLTSRYAMWMCWGPQLTFFCNDAYLPTVGVRRDWVLGARSDAVWREIWPEIGPRIETVLRDGEGGILDVADRGPGLTAAERETVFRPFGKRVSSRHYGGFGLSLWLSRSIIERHGGSIVALPNPGGGALFRVWLPLRTLSRSAPGSSLPGPPPPPASG